MHSIQGTKTEKALSWSIPVVNHTWLEDCFVQWRKLTVGLEKYIHFPSGFDFATSLAERGVGKVVVDDGDLELLEEGEVPEVAGMGKEPPIGTEVSAREVEEVEALFDGEGDVMMDGGGDDEFGVDGAKDKASPTRNRKNTVTKKAASRPMSARNDGSGERMAGRKISSDGKNMKEGRAGGDWGARPEKGDAESEEEEEGPKKPTRNLIRRSGTRIEFDILKTPASLKKNTKARQTRSAREDATDDDEPGPSARKEKTTGPSDEDDGESEIEVRRETKATAAKVKSCTLRKDTDEDTDSDVVLVPVAQPRGSSTKGKEKTVASGTEYEHARRNLRWAC